MTDRLRVVFMGTPRLSVKVLEALVESGHDVVGVLTRPGKPRGRGLEKSPSPVSIWAAGAGIPVMSPESLKAEGFLKEFKALSPQVLVGAAYGALVPGELLEVPGRGALNLHPSLLPRYRGPAPVQRAIMEGETLTGVTIHFIDEGMDTGDIVAQKEMTVTGDDTAGSLAERLFSDGARLMVEALDAMGEGEVARRSQDHTIASYAPALKREDEEIGWCRPCKDINNLVRALNPDPGAYTTLRGRRIKVWRGRVWDTQGGTAPGRIAFTEKELGFVVESSPGLFLVEEVQPAGKRSMHAWDFCMGRYVKEGDILGT